LLVDPALPYQQRIIATGDVRHGRHKKLVVARNRWFESISLQLRVFCELGSRLSGRASGCDA